MINGKKQREDMRKLFRRNLGEKLYLYPHVSSHKNIAVIKNTISPTTTYVPAHAQFNVLQKMCFLVKTGKKKKNLYTQYIF